MKIAIVLFLLFSSSLCFGFSQRFSFINCKPTSSQNINRNGTLDSISPATSGWDYISSYGSMVDGDKTSPALASGGAGDHNGKGFQLNFNRSLALKTMVISGYAASAYPTNYLVEYYNGSSWVPLQTFSYIEASQKRGIFQFNPNEIKSSHWRWSIINWGFAHTNFYLYEVEAYEKHCSLL